MFMKKFSSILAFCLCAVLVLSFAPPSNVRAYDDAEQVTSYTTYLPDGSYYVTTIREFDAVYMSAPQQKSGSKTVEGYDGNDNLLYSLTVKGTFTYDGKTSKAVSASYEYTLDASFWSFSDGSAYCSGNTATASGTFKRFWLFQPTEITVSLACSPNGTLS